MAGSKLPMGRCSVCDADVKVMQNGRPRPHKARRVRVGPDGGPQEYLAEECAGILYQAEVTP
jgi:hypothetical protein